MVICRRSVLLRSALAASCFAAAATEGAEFAERAERTEPLCEDTSLWGTAACVAHKSAGLAFDAISFSLEGRLPGGLHEAVLSQLPQDVLDVRQAVFEAANAGADSVRTGVASLLKVSSGALPRSTSESYVKAAAGWRDGFTDRYPEYETLISDDSSFVASFAFVAALAAVAGFICFRGACWLVGLWWRNTAGRVFARTPPEVLFFPDPSGRNVARICKEVGNARRRVWLAMFTLTDDLLSTAVLKAHARGLDVRVIVDDDQAEALGSDVQRLSQAGVPIVHDDSPSRMHHKFVILDNVVWSGSFNWTRQASRANRENVMVLRDRSVVEAFRGEFDKLWREYSRGRGNKIMPAVRRKREMTPPRRVGGA